jgi:hypothetical protein
MDCADGSLLLLVSISTSDSTSSGFEWRGSLRLLNLVIILGTNNIAEGIRRCHHLRIWGSDDEGRPRSLAFTAPLLVFTPQKRGATM